jgi:hypothetical protein
LRRSAVGRFVCPIADCKKCAVSRELNRRFLRTFFDKKIKAKAKKKQRNAAHLLTDYQPPN